MSFNSYTGGMLRSPPVKKAKKASPVTRMGWAGYYDRLEGEQAEHLCFWYLLLAHYYEEVQ